MFEMLIEQLDALGVGYTEDYDVGTLTIDVADMDKVQLIEVINIINDSGMLFNIDESSITVESGEMLEEPVEDFDEADMDAAMNDALGF